MNQTHAQDFVVDADHPCLPGHFPGRPLVPGVWILEEVARALRAWRHVAVTRIVEAKFIQPLLPAQAARITLSAGRAARQVRFTVHRGEVLLARGQLEHAA